MLPQVKKPPIDPWYADGLCFQCTGCGKCCTGAPGYVWLTEEEMQNIADFLKLSLQEFTQKYVRKVFERFSLKEHANYDCVFLKDKQCQIYPVRPSQCRTYPFWPRILASKEAWEEEATVCEGIRPSAPVVPLESLQKFGDVE